MNILANVIYYGSIVTVVLGVLGAVWGIWALFTTKGKQYIANHWR